MLTTLYGCKPQYKVAYWTGTNQTDRPYWIAFIIGVCMTEPVDFEQEVLVLNYLYLNWKRHVFYEQSFIFDLFKTVKPCDDCILIMF